MKPYFFRMKVSHKRTGEIIAVRCGVVLAENNEEAERIAWDKFGNDLTCGLDVWEIPEDGFYYTVYRSEIR